jgi:hypothetical protein
LATSKKALPPPANDPFATDRIVSKTDTSTFFSSLESMFGPR